MASEVIRLENRRPKIIRLGPGPDELNPDGWLPDIVKQELDWEELIFNPGDNQFTPNQDMKIEMSHSGLLIIEARQDHSTPGVKLGQEVFLEPGDYDIVVTGEASVGKTFFPWVRKVKTKLRLTPTVHLDTILDSVSAPFSLKEPCSVEIGVLCHHQDIGDRCAFSAVSIIKRKPAHIESKGAYNWIDLSSFIPHRQTILDLRDSFLKIRSEPVSTPGTYACIDVKPNTKVSIRAIIRMMESCTGFLYIANDSTNEELTRRTIVFDSNVGSKDALDEKFSYLDIPEGVDKIKIGVLFSSISTAEVYELEIHGIEVVEVVEFNKLVDKAYVLSLENEKEKFDVCQREAKRHDIKLDRWVASDGYSKNNLKNWDAYMKKPWSDLDLKLNRKAINKPGAWGYLLSMEAIFQQSVEDDLNCIAIFDDDFVLSNTFTHDLSRLIEQIGNDWDILYLGASQWAWDDVELHENKGYYLPTENTNGTFAVLYKHRVFEDVLRETRKMDSPFDSGPLCRLATGKFSNSSYVSFPNITIANVQKDGIRDSRNQVEYARRFRWDLENYPPWFTNWSIEPTIEREEWYCGFGPEDVDFFIGVTTYNRIEYLRNFINSFEETRNTEYKWCLIIADDGSTDGTIEWLREDFDPLDYGLVVIRNDSLGIARQSNSIFRKMMSMRVERKRVLFMCNDDIRFDKVGWDDLYFESIKEHGIDHLVYFNPDWKAPKFEEYKHGYNPLISYCNAYDVMGCFYTVTEDLIDKIGYFDEEEFPVRGHSHVDFTIRACRSNQNFLESTFDAMNSNDYISMEERESYKRTHKKLGFWEYQQLYSLQSRERRQTVLEDSKRKFIGWKANT